jgi:hypothetical protein
LVVKEDEVVSPFVFMDVACRLILELLHTFPFSNRLYLHIFAPPCYLLCLFFQLLIAPGIRIPICTFSLLTYTHTYVVAVLLLLFLFHSFSLFHLRHLLPSRLFVSKNSGFNSPPKRWCRVFVPPPVVIYPFFLSIHVDIPGSTWEVETLNFCVGQRPILSRYPDHRDDTLRLQRCFP